MAKLVPTRSSCLPRMTPGEKRFSERLEQKLEDDYLCWYDVPVGPKHLRPDFVVVHPQRGVLVLEVKDWKRDTIQSAARDRFELLTDRGLVTVANPLEQARSYAMQIEVGLRRDPQLRNLPDHRYAGKLVMPWGFGVVLANITRKQFDAAELGEVLPPDKVICQDEMLESVDEMAFQQRLWNMFTQAYTCKLSLPQLDRIRWHLFPEIRVGSGINQFGLFDPPNADKPQIEVQIPDLIRVMDVHQEQLARSMGEGHRVIHGVAGSGKTMILGYRCVKLARELAKPILVLCYNRTLAARLKQTIAAQGIAEQVTVEHFHGWCSKQLTAYNVNKPKYGIPADQYSAEMVERTIAAVDRGQIPRAQYGAVMIDEGHDLQPEWFKLIVQMLDPASNSMLVLYDDAQSIYGGKETSNKRPKFSFAKVGIQAVGRTTILKLNYRNTFEILAVARAFASELLAGEAADDDDGVPIIAPESAGRRGPMPELIQCESPEAEAKLIAARIRDEVDQGRSPDDIAVLTPNSGWAIRMERSLNREGVPFRSATTSEGKSALFDGEPSVKVVSMQSSKGLEFHSVYIPGICEMPGKGKDEANEARILYVAMTRATTRLALFASGKTSGFVEKLSKSLQ